MLIYSRLGARKFTSYDTSYGSNDEHFRIGKSAAAFAETLANEVAQREPLSILEVGCGQGQYLDLIGRLIRERRRAQLSEPRLIGVDGSRVGIEQCETRYPALQWINDEISAFLKDHDARVQHEKYSLIVDKCGVTSIRSEAEGQAMLDGFSGLLTATGMFAIIIARGFYETLRNRLYAKWSADWIQLAARKWGYTADLSDQRYHRYVYSDDPDVVVRVKSAPSAPASRPRKRMRPAAAPKEEASTTKRASRDTHESFDRLLDLLETSQIEVPDVRLHSHDFFLCRDLLDKISAPKVSLVESLDLKGGYVAVRHDCDHSMQNALTMARAEYHQGYRSTYFLLAPDGFHTTANYFGQIVHGKLEFNPKMIDAAKYLNDLGHEVGIHNDSITLGMYLKRDPGDVLREQIDFFEKNQIRIHGTAAHGSKMCRQLGYVNGQLFDEFRARKVRKECSGKTVEWQGFVFTKYSVKMADLGLKYEAYLLPRGTYVTDSSGVLAVNLSDEKDPAGITQVVMSRLQADPQTRMQFLIHPCHWLALVTGNKSRFSTVVRNFHREPPTVVASVATDRDILSEPT